MYKKGIFFLKRTLFNNTTVIENPNLIDIVYI